MESKINTLMGSLEFLMNNYNFIKASSINLIYEGLITHQVTKTFTSLTGENLEQQMENDTIQKRVFHVMVECLQNISKHADVKSQTVGGETKKGLILVSQGDSHYYIVTGNMVENKNTDFLRDKLDYLNSLNKEDLSKLYKENLKKNVLSDKGGAGLGFIDIARKSGEKFKFHFIPIDDMYTYFILITSIQRN